MLERLLIKNVALIEEADVRFDGGLNVLSGETGSGKSVILDSINFVLGSKADKSMIRYGTQEASVRAEFSIESDSAAAHILEEFDIEADNFIIISRRFSQEGKGAIKVNGNTVTTSMLKKLASRLVDVHGQSEHFFLLSESNQLTVIDTLCGEACTSLKDELAQYIKEKSEYKKKIAQLGGSEQERAQKLDLLAYQINEIESANITVGETERLKAKKKFFDNAERVISSINAIKEILSADNGCSDLLYTAHRQACGIADVDKEYESVCERLENLSIEASDLSETVSDIADNFSFDEAEAHSVEERLALIKNLTKKYGVDEEQILKFLENARAQYESLNDATAELEKLNKLIAKVDEKIYNSCSKLTELRKAKCNKFCSAVEEQLKTLNIPNARFYVDFLPYDRENLKVSANGADSICFMFSANKGEPPKPLGKVISGGEMSRFMLAVKTQLKGLNGISTYIFDEIDAGISGVTAKTVAQKFIAISKDTQIIAVSHLPQVCAAASAQFLISKSDLDNDKTVTKIKRLSREERITELIRLTGSVVTNAARQHAEELLNQFNN
ncbi:MAG: DNA repair protein RecN [Clostridia bacterium]|nr:DNA repair protein RecN [Clostridia bacterium]